MPHFTKIVVECNASALPHVSIFWLFGMQVYALFTKYFNQSLVVVEFYGFNWTVTKFVSIQSPQLLVMLLKVRQVFYFFEIKPYCA